MADELQTNRVGPKFLAGARREWKKVVGFSLVVTCYWLAVYWGVGLNQPELASFQVITRSLALTAATLIGWSLLSSLIFKWRPLTAQYWPYRRALGVAGFLFACGHILLVYHFYYDWRLDLAYYSLNPLKNPIVFGTLAFPLFMVMALTATDWAVAKLGGRRWKNIQRLVYPANFFLVFHFWLIAPDLTSTWPGGVLVLTTVAVLLGQAYWWLKISVSRGFRNKGFWVGLVMIGLYILFGIIVLSR